MEKKAKKKAFLIVELAVLSLFLLLFVGCLVAEISAPQSAIATWMKSNVWDVHKTFVSFKSHVRVRFFNLTKKHLSRKITGEVLVLF